MAATEAYVKRFAPEMVDWKFTLACHPDMNRHQDCSGALRSLGWRPIGDCQCPCHTTPEVDQAELFERVGKRIREKWLTVSEVRVMEDAGPKNSTPEVDA